MDLLREERKFGAFVTTAVLAASGVMYEVYRVATPNVRVAIRVPASATDRGVNGNVHSFVMPLVKAKQTYCGRLAHGGQADEDNVRSVETIGMPAGSAQVDCLVQGDAIDWPVERVLDV